MSSVTIPNTPTLASRVARIVAGLSVLMLLVAVLLGIRYSVNLILPSIWVWQVVLNSLNSAVYGVLAVMIITRHPRHTVGWLFLVVGFCFALAELAGGLFILALGMPIRSELVRGFITMLGHLVWAPWLLIPISLVLQFFPNGRLLSRHWWPVTAATVLALVGFEVSQAFYPPLPEWQGPLGAASPLAIAGTRDFFLWLFDASTTVFGLCVVVTWVSVVIRLFKSRGIERTQMKWLIYSAGVSFLFLSLMTIFPTHPIVVFLTGGDMTNPLILHVISLIFPLTTGIAILRHRLFDIDVVIQRTLVYGGLSLGIIAIYVLVVGALGTLIQAQGSYLLGLLATGIIAALFQPVRAWLQRRVNRLVYGDRDEPYRVLTRLGQRLEASIEPASALPLTVETVAHALKLPYVTIMLQQGGEARTVASYGDIQNDLTHFTLVYAGEIIGEMAVASRGPNESLTSGDRQLLSDLARQIGVAAHATLLAADLERARLRIVTAREEARRRLGSDLHDGVGHQLAGLARQVEGAAQLLDSDLEVARESLTVITSQLNAAIAQVRGMAHQMHPPELELLGLIGALRERAQTHPSLRIHLSAPESAPPLPTAIETAAYYISLEALNNIEKHAGVRSCQIRVAFAQSEQAFGLPVLEVDIMDNGKGLSGSQSGGLGLLSMQARAAEVGGLCRIEANQHGGTKVSIRLPCPDRPPVETAAVET